VSLGGPNAALAFELDVLHNLPLHVGGCIEDPQVIRKPQIRIGRQVVTVRGPRGGTERRGEMSGTWGSDREGPL